MRARKYPGLIRYARRIRAEREKIAAEFHQPQVLLHLLGNDVAEHAPFFLLEVFAAGAQFVQHAARHECRGGQLRVRMAEFLPGAGAVVLEDADVLEASIALEILYAVRSQ